MEPSPRKLWASAAWRLFEDWSTRAGDDTDLFVFSHGAWIAQTLQTLLGISANRSDLSTVVSFA